MFCPILCVVSVKICQYNDLYTLQQLNLDLSILKSDGNEGNDKLTKERVDS